MYISVWEPSLEFVWQLVHIPGEGLAGIPPLEHFCIPAWVHSYTLALELVWEHWCTLVEEHTYTLPGELDAEHHSIVPWAPGEECPRRLRLFLAVAHFGILCGALGDRRSGIPPSLVDEVLCCIPPVRLGDTLLSLLDAAPLWGYLGNFLSLLVEVLARVPARTLPEELDCKRREELVWPRDYRPLWVLGYSFPFLVVEEHLGIPLWLPVGILLAAHREECYSNLSTPLGDKLA